MAIDIGILSFLIKAEEYFGKTVVKWFLGLVFFATVILLIDAIIPVLFKWSEHLAELIGRFVAPDFLNYIIGSVLRVVFYLPAGIIAVYIASLLVGKRLSKTLSETKKLLILAQNKYEEGLKLEKEGAMALEESKRLNELSNQKLEEAKAILLERSSE